MTHERLEQLSKDELIEIILRQEEIQEMLELRQARIEQLEARVAEVEAQIERLLTGPPRDCSNSSLPPAKSPKPNRDSLFTLHCASLMWPFGPAL
ncbi:MAG: hypothetical protein AB7W28_05505 [Armatimonadota bacterium]